MGEEKSLKYYQSRVMQEKYKR